MTCSHSTHLVSSIELNAEAGTYDISFVTVPTVKDGSCFKFRFPCNVTTVATPSTPIRAGLNINGTVTFVPLWDCVGNVLRTGTTLRTRKVYCAIYGNDPAHLMIKEAKKCSKTCCL